jgi:hypothetical protein
MWQYHRSTRRTLVLSQIVLSCAVEASTVLHKPTALAIAACKFAAFQWFAVFGRYDAPRSSGLVVPGLWCARRARVRVRRARVVRVGGGADSGSMLTWRFCLSRITQERP